MKLIQPNLSSGKKFLFGDQLTIADFWIGGLYVNWASNPDIVFGSGEWLQFLNSNPLFTKYGERFRAENSKYLNKRKNAHF